MNIITGYTSGSTGKPKRIMHTTTCSTPPSHIRLTLHIWGYACKLTSYAGRHMTASPRHWCHINVRVLPSVTSAEGRTKLIMLKLSRTVGLLFRECLQGDMLDYFRLNSDTPLCCCSHTSQRLPSLCPRTPSSRRNSLVTFEQINTLSVDTAVFGREGGVWKETRGYEV